MICTEDMKETQLEFNESEIEQSHRRRVAGISPVSCFESRQDILTFEKIASRAPAYASSEHYLTSLRSFNEPFFRLMMENKQQLYEAPCFRLPIHAWKNTTIQTILGGLEGSQPARFEQLTTSGFTTDTET
jgi:hypothetical protein